MAELLRGEVRIERASLMAGMLIDLREQAPNPAARPIDRAKLVKWFPAQVEAPEAALLLKTESHDLEVAGLALSLKREGDALRGQVLGQSARALLTKRGVPGEAELALKVESPLAWTSAGVAMDALAVSAGKSSLRGSLKLEQGVLLALAGDDVAIEDFGTLLPAEISGRGRVDLRVEGVAVTASVDLRNASFRGHVLDRLKTGLRYVQGATVLRELAIERGSARYRAEVLAFDPDFIARQAAGRERGVGRCAEGARRRARRERHGERPRGYLERSTRVQLE